MDVRYDQATGLYRSGKLGLSVGLTPDMLAGAYLRFKQEGRIETIYYERVPSIIEYLNMVTKPEHISLGCFVDQDGDGKNWQFAGICWVFDRQELGNGQYKAEVGFGFFEAGSTSRQKVELGRLAVHVTFNIFNIDVLFGTTPTENRAARRYTRAVGFDMMPAPLKNFISWEGALSDAWISTLSKTDWAERNQVCLQKACPDLDKLESSPEFKQIAEGVAA